MTFFKKSCATVTIPINTISSQMYAVNTPLLTVGSIEDDDY